MSTTYTWTVTGLRNTADGTVVQTYWEKTGTDADGNSGTFVGATPFDNGDPTDPDYIAFADLTEADVLGWIQAEVVDAYEEHVNAEIQRRIDEVSTSDAALPWVEPDDHPPVSIEPEPASE